MNNKGSDSTKWPGRMGGTGEKAGSNKGNAIFDKTADSHRSSVASRTEGSPRDKGKGHHA